MLKINNINVGYYGGIQVIRDVSLSISEGEIVALVGANGAGKSTIIKTIAGILHPASGSITFKGEQIETMSPQKIVSKGIGMVPEGRRVFPYMTVRENLELGAYVVKRKAQVQENLKRVFDLFPRLEERQNQLASTFSGGEQQMLVIARAIMSRPHLLMMDEPSLGLAPIVVKEVFESINTLHHEGVTILLVEQNIRKSLEIAQRGYVLENGRIALSESDIRYTRITF